MCICFALISLFICNLPLYELRVHSGKTVFQTKRWTLSLIFLCEMLMNIIGTCKKVRWKIVCCYHFWADKVNIFYNSISTFKYTLCVFSSIFNFNYWKLLFFMRLLLKLLKKHFFTLRKMRHNANMETWEAYEKLLSIVFFGTAAFVLRCWCLKTRNFYAAAIFLSENSILQSFILHSSFEFRVFKTWTFFYLVFC